MPSDTVVAAVLAAVAAGYFGLLGLIVTKDAKTSDLRQAWIDALRSDASNVVAQIEALASLNGQAGVGDEWRKAQAAFRVSEVSVRLRLPQDVTSKQAVHCLDQLSGHIDRGDWSSAAIAKACRSFVDAMQPILKEAWEHVKRGESWFRGVKAASILLIALGAGSVAYLAYLQAVGPVRVAAPSGQVVSPP